MDTTLQLEIFGLHGLEHRLEPTLRSCAVPPRRAPRLRYAESVVQRSRLVVQAE